MNSKESGMRILKMESLLLIWFILKGNCCNLKETSGYSSQTSIMDMEVLLVDVKTSVFLYKVTVL